MAARRMMKSPPKAEDDHNSQPMRLTVSKPLYRYLTWLKTHTMLGVSENDVAVAILTERLREMRRVGYCDPPLEETEGKAEPDQSES
jgi:hypothetical protein